MEPNDPHRCELPDPLDEALSALLSREIDPEMLVLIEDALRHDPGFRKTYLRLMETEAMIASEFPAVHLPGWTEGARPVRKAGYRTGRVMALAAAAMVALLATAGWWFHGRTEEPLSLADAGDHPEPRLTLAKVTALNSVTTSFEGRTLAEGDRLREGLLELDDGTVEVTFDSGAVFTLVGPAMFRLESEFRGSLLDGDANARVPEQARGFVVLTPSSYLRDLGTSFTVSVKDSKVTDIHVIEGSLEASPSGNGSREVTRLLRNGEAVRLLDGSIRNIAFDDSRIPMAGTAPAPADPAVHWSFENWNGNRTQSDSGAYTLEMRRGRTPVIPTLVEGPVGQGMLLDGYGQFGVSDYPGVGGSAARTVCFWILLQPDVPSDAHTPNGIIAWGVNRASRKWQVAWNKGPMQGVIGAPRIEFGEGYVIGSTDLRDGLWHHVAVVYLGGEDADVSTHIRLYVDGRLEQASGRRQQVISTDTSSELAVPLNVGRYLGRWVGREPFFFQGGLDEVQVFEEAILPSQIFELSRSPDNSR